MKYSFTELSETPLNQYAFYDYVMGLKLAGESVNPLKSIFDFFKNKGFDPKNDTIDKDSIKTAWYIYENICRNYRAKKYQFKKSEVLTESVKCDKNAFWCESDNKYYKLSDSLVDIINNAGVIYEISPDDYYFNVNDDGVLTIKYQYIIGSRVICKLID